MSHDAHSRGGIHDSARFRHRRAGERDAELKHQRLSAGTPGKVGQNVQVMTSHGSVLLPGRAVGGVGSSVVGVDADPHAVTPMPAGEVRKARGEGQPDASLPSVLGDG